MTTFNSFFEDSLINQFLVGLCILLQKNSFCIRELPISEDSMFIRQCLRYVTLPQLTCALRRADIHHMDDYGVSPSDLAQDEEMMRALGLYKSIVMLENTAAFVIKVLYVRCLFLN